MKRTPALRATVKSATKYLEPNIPTGLTGLSTHPSPRSALLYTYNTTLTRLKAIPESSVYRQSTEALTKHRLQIVQSQIPPGYDSWKQRVIKAIDADPQAYGKLKNKDGSISYGEFPRPVRDVWDGRVSRKDAIREGPGTESEAEYKGKMVTRDVEEVDANEERGGEIAKFVDLDREPPLTADQISQIETQIGAGLIEEVVVVAEGELDLVNEMIESKAWEDLEEKTPPGQWEYFDRGDRV